MGVPGRDEISESSSGLRLVPFSVTRCSLYGGNGEGELECLVALESGVELIVTKQDCNREFESAIGEIERSFGVEGSHLPMPWLDDWERCSPENTRTCADCPFSCEKTAEIIEQWSSVEIEVMTSDLLLRFVIAPDFVDRDGTIFRIKACGGSSILYFDIRTPNLSLTSLSVNKGRLQYLLF